MQTSERTRGITAIPHGDGSLVTLVGDIDAALRPEASLAMADVLARGGPVVVDLAGVSFIDSSGLAFVIQLHRLGVEDGVPCVLRDAPANVLDLLEMIGLLDEVTLEVTTDDALAEEVDEALSEVVDDAVGLEQSPA